MDELNYQDSSYGAILDQFRATKDRITSGFDTVREENSINQLQARMRARLQSWGLGRTDPQSAFDKYEQAAIARGDRLSRLYHRAGDLGFGGAQLGLNMAKFFEVGATHTGEKLGLASMLTGLGGMGRLSSTLGRMGEAANPLVIAQLGLEYAQGSFQHSVVDPFTNRRMFSSTALGGLRGTLGGVQSNRGFGGLDMSGASTIGRMTQSLAWNSKDISADKMNEFLQAATQMPQMQYMTNPDQAVQGIAKFMDVMIKLSKQFKGKEQEVIQSLQQFGRMGMGVDQSSQAMLYTSRMGSYLNVSPSQIMGAGANALPLSAGNNIAQSTMFMMGAQNYAQVERMRQSGAFSPIQLQNFGGSEGIANILNKSQSGFLQGDAGNLYLKAIYDPTSRDKINHNMLNRITTGRTSLDVIRSKAYETTLNPKANMDFQFDKEFLIGKLGADVNAFTYNAWNSQFANKSPFGKDLNGRARWLQAYQGMDKNTALINAQAWMSYNPQMENYLQEEQTNQMLLNNDPYYSSQTNFGVGLKTMKRGISRQWEHFKQGSVGGVFTPGTSAYENFWGFGGAIISNMTGASVLTDAYDRFSTTKSMRGFTPFDRIKSAKEFSSAFSDLRADKELGARVWGESQTQVNKRQMARFLAGDNIEDLLASDADKSALADWGHTFEHRLLGGDISGTGWAGRNNRDSGYAQAMQKQQDMYKKYSGMSTGDIMKDMDKSVSEYMTSQGMDANMILPGVDGHDLKVKNYLNSKWMQTYLSDEQRKQIADSELSVNDPNKFQSPYDPNKLTSFEQLTGTGLRGNITRGIIGALVPGTLGIPNLLNSLERSFRHGGTRDQERIAGFASRFDSVDIDGQSKLYNKLLNLSKREGKISEAEKLELGLSPDADVGNVKDILNKFGDANNESDLAWLLDPKNKDNPKRQVKLEARRKEDHYRNVAEGIIGVYGSTSYQNLAASYGAGPDFFKNFFGKALGKEGLDTTISEKDFNDLKKNLKNTPGLGEIFRDEFLDYSDGQVKLKDDSTLSKSQKRRLKEGLEKNYANLTGREDHALQSADQVWSNRGQPAKTIQDFAVAVSKGMQMFRDGSSDLNSWNQVKTDITIKRGA